MVLDYGIIQLITVTNCGDWNQWFPWASVICFCACAAVLDVARSRIPNMLTGPAWVGGLLWAAAIGGWPQFGNAVFASALLAFPFIVMFLFALGGAGDAKLMAAVGAWLGVSTGLQTLVLVCLAGGIIGILAALMRRRLPMLVANLQTMILWITAVSRSGIWSVAQGGPPPMTNIQRMPYALPVLVGVCLAAGGLRLW